MGIKSLASKYGTVCGGSLTTAGILPPHHIMLSFNTNFGESRKKSGVVELTSGLSSGRFDVELGTETITWPLIGWKLANRASTSNLS